MTIEEILNRYDQEQRELVQYPGIRREVTPHVIRRAFKAHHA
jgi:hypothetical protein